MTRMNWERANKKDIVRKRGGDTTYVALSRIAETPKKSNKSKKRKKNRRGKKAVVTKQEPMPASCPASGDAHEFSAWTEYAFPHFSRSRTCNGCGATETKTKSDRALSGPSTKQLEQRLARLTGVNYVNPDTIKLITSKKSDPTPRRHLGTSFNPPEPKPIKFDRSIHVVRRNELDQKWHCRCSWIGSEQRDRFEATRLHAEAWYQMGAQQQKVWEIEAVNSILAERQEIEPEG